MGTANTLSSMNGQNRMYLVFSAAAYLSEDNGLGDALLVGSRVQLLDYSK